MTEHPSTTVPSLGQRLIRGAEVARSFGPRGRGLAAFLAYLVPSLVAYGGPVLGRLSGTYVGYGQGDAKIYIWCLSWWPHAVAQGVNPFLPRVIWAPTGINLAWVTCVPGPAFLMAPVTELLGPVAASNILALLAPPLAAWSAYLLCRRATRAFWPSVVGGYLFGFSTYMTAEMHGHMNLFLVFPIPLCAYLVLRRLDGDMGPALFVTLLGGVLVAEFTISTEVFATMTFFGGLALLGVFLFALQDKRRPLLNTTALIGLAYLLAGVMLAPYLFYVAIGRSTLAPAHSIANASADVLSFLLPRSSVLIGATPFYKITRHFTANSSEDGAYMSIPVIVALAHAAVTRWRNRADRLLFGWTGVAALASLGPKLHLDGRPIIDLPWAALDHLPLLQYALPKRFTVYVWLGTAVLLARWLASRNVKPWIKWGAVGISAVLLVPNTSSRQLHPEIRVPEFFATGTYRRYLSPGETILIIHRAKGEDMLWQAETHFYFRMAQGHTGVEPPEFAGLPVWSAIRHNEPLSLPLGDLRQFLTAHGVSSIVLEEAQALNWEPTLSFLHVQPFRVGDVEIYDLQQGTTPSVPGRRSLSTSLPRPQAHQDHWTHLRTLPADPRKREARSSTRY